MMNRIFASVFAIIFIVSILEVTTFNSKESNEHDESFHEFDDDPSFEYSSKAAHKNNENSENEDDIEIRQPTGVKPITSFSTPINMPPIRFSFCVSCGYRQAFDQLSQVLYEKYAGIQVEGSNYPPTTLKAVLAQFIGFIKIALIAMIIVSRDPFVLLGIPTPQIFTWMMNNKVSSCLMLFMVSNSIESMLMSTGAFEIYVGEEQIWSKLESGRPPSPGELIQSIDSYLAIKGKTLTESSFGFGGDN